MTKKRSKKKKSVAKPAAIGLAVLAAIGIVSTSDKEPESESPDSSVVVSASKSQNAEITEEPDGNIEIIVDAEPEENIPEQKPDLSIITSAKEESQQNNPAPSSSAPIVEQPKQESSTENTPVPQIDPEKAFRDKLLQYAYVGSAESDKYHKPTCRWTGNINDVNLVHFDSEDEAVASGYIPCGTCKP